VYIPKGILEKNKKGCLVFFRKAQTTKAFHLKLENTYQDKTIHFYGKALAGMKL